MITAANDNTAQSNRRTQAHVVGYIVINRRTNKSYKHETRGGATRAADRMDSAYGAICCITRAIWSDHDEAQLFA